MTKVSFEKSEGKYKKLLVSGHSGYAESGYDIVCASVSSCVNLTASVLEKSGEAFRMDVGEKTATVIIELTDTSLPVGQIVFSAAEEQMKELAEEFPENVKVTAAERIR